MAKLKAIMRCGIPSALLNTMEDPSTADRTIVTTNCDVTSIILGYYGKPVSDNADSGIQHRKLVELCNRRGHNHGANTLDEPYFHVVISAKYYGFGRRRPSATSGFEDMQAEAIREGKSRIERLRASGNTTSDLLGLTQARVQELERHVIDRVYGLRQAGIQAQSADFLDFLAIAKQRIEIYNAIDHEVLTELTA
jgi:hypothetical protein